MVVTYVICLTDDKNASAYPVFLAGGWNADTVLRCRLLAQSQWVRSGCEVHEVSLIEPFTHPDRPMKETIQRAHEAGLISEEQALGAFSSLKTASR
jgi:hypothetical protein